MPSHGYYSIKMKYGQLLLRLTKESVDCETDSLNINCPEKIDCELDVNCLCIEFVLISLMWVNYCLCTCLMIHEVASKKICDGFVCFLVINTKKKLGGIKRLDIMHLSIVVPPPQPCVAMPGSRGPGQQLTSALEESHSFSHYILL